MDEFQYNSFGRMMTGFDNSIDHSIFGHWRNPEYQEACQIEEGEPLQESIEMISDNPSVLPSDTDDLPF